MPILLSFINSLTDKTFKILPLYEEKNIFLFEHLDSLRVDLLGGTETFTVLESNQKYITLINIIQYMLNNEFTHKQCKREVFKMISIINSIKLSLEGCD